ncbi:MAG: aldo/keto reductase [Candidatus Nanopelagicaceae bacterium]|jgi:D-threo-aldose 1-dehydrogenase
MSRHNQKISLKRTPLEITRLGLGTAPLGGMFTSVAEQDSDDLIATAFELGINYFDTAPLYGYGRSEVRLGRALRAAKQNFVLSTKVGRVLNPTSNSDREFFKDADPTKESVYDWSADGVKRSINESLERLGLDHIDMVLLHDCEDFLEQTINEAYPVLDSYRSQGIIKAVGMGLNLCAPSVKVMKETDLDCALIAGRYTLLDQEAQEELFPLALKKNVSMIIGGVYNSGVLANPVKGASYNYAPVSEDLLDRALAIKAFLAERGISLTAAAIQFPLRHPAVTTVLTGSRSAAELRANVADFDADIPDSVWSELESSGLIKPLSLS